MASNYLKINPAKADIICCLTCLHQRQLY